MKYKRVTSNLLRRLCVNNSYKGFHYTAYGVSQVIRDPELLTCISKGLYIEIASRFQTSIGCVERDIRTVVKTIWEHGDKMLLYEVFGFEIELQLFVLSIRFQESMEMTHGEFMT